MFRCAQQRTCQAKAANTDLPHFEYHLPNVPGYLSRGGKFWCWVSADKTEQARAICKSMGREEPESWVGGNYFILN